MAEPMSTWPPAIYHTDASGGEHSRTASLSRVQFAGVQLAPEIIAQCGSLVARLFRLLRGPVAGRHTVNRGETSARVMDYDRGRQRVFGSWRGSTIARFVAGVQP